MPLYGMNETGSRAGTWKQIDDIARVLTFGGQLVCFGSLGLIVVLVMNNPSAAARTIAWVLAGNVINGAAIIGLSRRGHLKAAMTLIFLGLLAVTAVGVFGVGYGLKSSGFVLYITIICTATLFFGHRAGWFATGLGFLLLGSTYAIEKAYPVFAPTPDRQGSILTSLAAVILLLMVVFVVSRSFFRRNQAVQSELIAEAQALEHAIAQREQAQQESEAFFASLSHAIRTPMVGIQSGLQLLKDDRVPASKREVYLRSLRRSARELDAFVNSLLDFKSSRRGLMVTDLKSCDLGVFLASLFAQFKASAAEKALHWFLHADAAVSAHVLVDEKRLHQVLSILLSNAVKFARTGDSVSLSALPLDMDEASVVWTFTVSDTGPGIDADILNRIFQPFTQSATDAANQTAGTGIGLALAQELSGLMGGSLQVSSEPGQGSRFWLVLPLQRASQPNPSGGV